MTAADGLTGDPVLYTQKTIIQTYDPDDGDRYVPLLELDGAGLVLDPRLRLTIGGEQWRVLGRRHVGVDTTGPQSITTVITVIRDDD